MKNVLKILSGWIIIAVIIVSVAAFLAKIAVWSREKVTITQKTTTLEYIIHEERGVICFYLQTSLRKEGLSCLPLER